MRKAMKTVLAGAAAMMAVISAPANAATFLYSYTFGSSAPGATVNGSFTGDGPITAITNIANVTLNINGTPISNVSAYRYTGYPGPNNGSPAAFPLGGAIASSNASLTNTLNNFVFSTPGFAQYFYIIPWSNGAGNQVAVQAKFGTGPTDYIPAGTVNTSYNGTFVPANFVLTAVPEPATWAMMLAGFGMIGFGLRSRRKQAARVTYA